MKVKEVLINLLDLADTKDKQELLNKLIDNTLENIKNDMVSTNSVDKIIKLKNTYKELQSLKHRTRNLNSSVLEKEFSKFIFPYSL
jgi:hypothetical protein